MNEKFFNEALHPQHIPKNARALGKVSEDPDTWAIGCDTCSFTYTNKVWYDHDVKLLTKLQSNE